MSLKQNIPWMTNPNYLQMPQGASVCEITEDWYNNIFNGVPPFIMGARYFACGEPHSHVIINNKLYPTYSLFTYIEDNGKARFFYLGEITELDKFNVLPIIHNRLYE